MRAECEETEVGLSYIRRLAQGRLDIVHRALDTAGSPDDGDGDDERADSWPPWSRTCRRSCRVGHHRPAGPGRLPMLMAPDTELPELTAELDAVLDAVALGTLHTMGVDELQDVATVSTVIEHRISSSARAPRPHRRVAGPDRQPLQDRAGHGRRPSVVTPGRSAGGGGDRMSGVKEPARTERAHFVKELPDRFNELGSFIREQRNTARLSLRRLSELAGISNPYLSQIERGLRRPSAEILQQIAKALRISAETLYVQAGILEKPTGDADLARDILADVLPHRGAEAGADPDLSVLPSRERRRRRRARRRCRSPGDAPGAGRHPPGGVEGQRRRARPPGGRRGGGRARGRPVRGRHGHLRLTTSVTVAPAPGLPPSRRPDAPAGSTGRLGPHEPPRSAFHAHLAARPAGHR